MSQTQALHQQIAQLPALEQIALVEEILHRLDAPDSSVDALWAIEAENRMAAYRGGRCRPLDERWTAVWWPGQLGTTATAAMNTLLFL